MIFKNQEGPEPLRSLYYYFYCGSACTTIRFHSSVVLSSVPMGRKKNPLQNKAHRIFAIIWTKPKSSFQVYKGTDKSHLRNYYSPFPLHSLTLIFIMKLTANATYTLHTKNRLVLSSDSQFSHYYCRLLIDWKESRGKKQRETWYVDKFLMTKQSYTVSP